jgi:hypothetical protein
MAGEASTFGAGRALDAINGRATATARTVYLALLSAAPNDGSTLATMTEITTAGYARQAVTWSTPTGDPAVVSNSGVLTFGPFTADPPNVTHAALVSAVSGTSGDFLYWWTLDNARDAANGDSLTVAAAALVMQLD